MIELMAVITYSKATDLTRLTWADACPRVFANAAGITGVLANAAYDWERASEETLFAVNTLLELPGVQFAAIELQPGQEAEMSLGGGVDLLGGMAACL